MLQNVKWKGAVKGLLLNRLAAVKRYSLEELFKRASPSA